MSLEYFLYCENCESHDSPEQNHGNRCGKCGTLLKILYVVPKKWTIDCEYYSRSFDTLEELIEDILTSGMDPNYNLMRHGEKQNETAWDYIQV